jgi:hypothetical protein
MQQEPNQPPVNQPKHTSVDEKIAAVTNEVYTFEHGKEKRSVKEWFRALPRTRKAFIVGGCGMAVFIAVMISLSLSGGQTTNESAIGIGTSTDESSSSQLADTNNDGVVDVNDSSEEDADNTSNSDGSDSSTSNDSDSTNVSWWQRLLSIKNSTTSTSTNSSSSTSSSNDIDYSSINTSYTDYTSFYQDKGYADYASYTEASAGTPVKIATWNVLKYDNTQTNLRNGVNDIFTAGATVIGLQEISDPSFTPNSVKKLASGSIGAYSPEGGSAIVWDAKTVDKLSADSFHPIAGKEKQFAYARFRVKSTGQEFYVINQHMQPGVNGSSQGCGSTNCKYFKEQMQTLVAKTKALQSAKIPIFLIGDFNVDYSIDNCKVTWYPCYALGKIGLTSSYKALGLKSTIGSAKKYIDQVYFWTPASTDILPVSNKILGANASCKKSNVRDIDGDIVIHCWNGSDHKPVLFTAKLTANS